MTDTTTPEFFTDQDLPAADPVAVEKAYTQIMGRHVLATLRAERGMTLDQIATERGVTKAAVHQVENKPLGNLQISSMLNYLQGLGYDVDENWLASAVVNSLPALKTA